MSDGGAYMLHLEPTLCHAMSRLYINWLINKHWYYIYAPYGCIAPLRTRIFFKMWRHVVTGWGGGLAGRVSSHGVGVAVQKCVFLFFFSQSNFTWYKMIKNTQNLIAFTASFWYSLLISGMRYKCITIQCSWEQSFVVLVSIRHVA